MFLKTVNVATLQPPGVVDVVFVQGPAVNVTALGALTTTTPDPPALPALAHAGW
jgi:hypothetical protein